MQNVSRLIEWFTPEHYNLSLTLNRTERSFQGTITLEGVSHIAKEMRLHAKELVIDSITIDGHSAEWQKQDNDEVLIHSSFLQKDQKHIIVCTYNGKITDGMHGVYPCYYEIEGTPYELLATQFESHHAREVFPCIDEPAAKATFDITLSTEKEVTVLGNMPITEQREENDKLVTTFERTPRMSTYLVAWVVGNLQKVSGKTKRGIEVNIWSTPAQPIESLTFSLDIAIRSIDFYEEYFKTDYPLPKSDHVALPDFSSGAMENWGLITYREIALLAHPETTSISSRQYIATVVAHELAHQWFGNLVTMKWWNDLWLNESFANMMEYLAVDALEPSWNMWLDFSSNEAVAALRRDSFDGVQSVQIEVHHPDEINTLFDAAIVYAKGGRLLRMLQTYLGDSAFQQGLQEYFSVHQYGNTEANDLWVALGKASGKDIAHLMQAWISQPGYPLVTVQRQEDESITLTQSQFFVGSHEPSTSLWPIPLDGSSPEIPSLMTTKTISFASSAPVQLNTRDSGHFITFYDTDTLASLLEKVQTGTLPVINRLQLLNEASLLARAGVIPSASLLTYLSAYRHEKNEAVWGLIGATLNELKKFVDPDSPEEKKLRALAGSLAEELYERLGWTPLDQESEDDTKLRSTIISFMLYSERPEVIEKAHSLYHEKPVVKLDPQLRSLILSTVIRYAADDQSFNDLYKLYESSSSAELKLDLTASLTATRQKSQIMTLLNNITDSSKTRPQDVAYWFVYLLRNREARSDAWQWLQTQWPWIIETFGGTKDYDDYPRYSASGLMTPQELNEYKAFFEPLKKDPSLRRVITVGISELEGRIELIEKDKTAVRERLLQLDF